MNSLEEPRVTSLLPIALMHSFIYDIRRSSTSIHIQYMTRVTKSHPSAGMTGFIMAQTPREYNTSMWWSDSGLYHRLFKKVACFDSDSVIWIKWRWASFQDKGAWEIAASVSVLLYFWQAIGFECSAEHQWGERKDNICLTKPADGNICFPRPTKVSLPIKVHKLCLNDDKKRQLHAW